MNEANDKAKCPNTEALVVRAIETYGLTQKAIAELCDVHQSVVSGWKSGKIIARWEQVKPLIEKYGDIQSEHKGKVYNRITNSSYVFDEEAVAYLEKVLGAFSCRLAESAPKDQSFEDVYNSMKFRLSILENILNSIKKQHSLEFETVDDVNCFLNTFNENTTKEHFFEWVLGRRMQSALLKVAHRYEKEYVKIYGDLLFDYTFSTKEEPGVKDFNWMKWSVISTAKGEFAWVVSKKKHLNEALKVDQNHEHAAWLSEVHEKLDAESLMNKAKAYNVDPQYEECFDRDVLLFSLVHTFSQNGYELKCVSTLS